jgi:hypothetical protein
VTPSQIGERAEAAVVAALTHAGHAVYLPFGASGRCDLIFESSDGLARMQVKNGILRNGIVRFATCSNTRNVPIDYRNDVDVFGVPRNNQQRNIRWAEQFRLDWSPPALELGAEIVTDPDLNARS